MALPKQKLREIVFQLLYIHGLDGLEEDQVPFLMSHHEVTKKAIYEAVEQKKSLVNKLNEIDALIAKTATEYDFDRISLVEKNVLRLGIYELCFVEEIPPKVAIAEAIRLSRKFGAPEGASFVNAILDAIYCTLRKENPLVV